MNEQKRFFSPAKVNLYLEVLSKNKNGFHNLNSMMCFCDIGDYLSIEKSNEFSIETAGPFSKFLCNYENNLITIALKKFEKIVKQRFSVKIFLHKNLPIGSGLGGGSSNAAIVIKEIIKIYNVTIAKKTLDKFLFSVGSDIPFCFYGKTSVVSSSGNILKPIENFNESFILLVNPMVEIPTKEIFNKVKIFNYNPSNFVDKKISKENFIKFLSRAKNDLEPIVVDLYPEVGCILSTFSKTKADLKRMSGSGATCFGLFKSKKDLKEAENQFLALKNKWWIKKGKILNDI